MAARPEWVNEALRLIREHERVGKGLAGLSSGGFIRVWVGHGTQTDAMRWMNGSSACMQVQRERERKSKAEGKRVVVVARPRVTGR